MFCLKKKACHMTVKMLDLINQQTRLGEGRWCRTAALVNKSVWESLVTTLATWLIHKLATHINGLRVCDFIKTHSWMSRQRTEWTHNQHVRDGSPQISCGKEFLWQTHPGTWWSQQLIWPPQSCEDKGREVMYDMWIWRCYVLSDF